MSIPESQLQTWSNQGAVVTAQNTHNSIRTALESYRQWPDDVKYEPYLQGSYKNSTNIYGNSDVDLVVELTSVFWSNLTDEEKTQLGIRNVNYDWGQFRQDVISALNNYYGSNQIDTSGKKSVKVRPSSGRLNADVVISGKYKYYESQKLRAEGIILWTQPGWEEIINYPKVHFDNGAYKNSDFKTNGLYKPSIRMFKNARDKFVGSNPLLKDRFPSYFIECLLYNVPNKCFGTSYHETYAAVVNWLNDEFNKNSVSEFVCQNGMFYLFGSSSVQWNVNDAREFVNQLINLWNNW